VYVDDDDPEAVLRHYVTFARPFTLIAPMLGVVSGALTAWGSRHSLYAGRSFGGEELVLVLIAALAAALLNAASNGVNQVYDLEIDRVNKPHRPLPAGLINRRGALLFTCMLYCISVAVTWIVVPSPDLTWRQRLTAPLWMHECIFFYLVAALFTLVYSVPGLGRTKQRTFAANLTIAIPRGLMLKVAGWSVLASVRHLEPWYIGLCFFLFLLGASSTKDFSDMAGDRLGECRTLPNVFGIRRAAWMIAPFFVLPWMLIPLGLVLKPNGHDPILSGSPVLLLFLGGSLIVWGGYTLYLILRDPDALSREENHPSWRHMYLMMFWAQAGFALAYIVN
jgi:4-hydroxybenzoate polyprenyltransferase